MSLYSRGEYLKAVEQQAMAEVIAKVLYPDDNHYEGKSLRLKQQYFFVSATVQSIVRKHRAQYGTLRNFHEKHVIQINDTHPTLVIPELMRILLDVEGYSWDEAWNIVTHTVAYTNHTVLAEALERWPQRLIETLLPRIWQILKEIAARYQRTLEQHFHGDQCKVANMAIIWGGEVRMANLCVCACYAVNGVSALHSEILKQDVFHDAYYQRRTSSRTSPTASTTAAGCPRSTPSWTPWCRSAPAGTTTCSTRRPSAAWRSTRTTRASSPSWRPSRRRTSAASPPMWPGSPAWC